MSTTRLSALAAGALLLCGLNAAAQEPAALPCELRRHGYARRRVHGASYEDALHGSHHDPHPARYGHEIRRTRKKDHCRLRQSDDRPARTDVSAHHWRHERNVFALHPHVIAECARRSSEPAAKVASKDFAAIDPEFWNPKPASMAKPAAKPAEKSGAGQ